MLDSRRLLIASCTILVLFLAACAPISSVTIGMDKGHSVHAEKGRHPGPPPHAPAHGHRHKQKHQGEDLELTFNSDLGVYIVVGMPNRYYWEGTYLRVDGDQWYASVNLDSGWAPRAEDSIPPGLKKRGKHPKAKNGKPKKSHPAKGRW
jgi:hypothetical protein